MGAGGQSQKVESSLTVLRMNHHGKYREEDRQHSTLHLFVFLPFYFFTFSQFGHKGTKYTAEFFFYNDYFLFLFPAFGFISYFCTALWKRRKVGRLIWSMDGYAGSFWGL
jgi:hypothetical protein